MHTIIRRGAAALLLCLNAAMALAQQTTVPAALSGNWLKTDGSNQFVIGLYNGVACYQDNVSLITAITGSNDHWQITLAGKRLGLSLKDAHTLILMENGQQQTLKHTRTYNYGYRPIQQPLKQPLFRVGTATVKGYLQLPATAPRNKLQYNYVLISYENVLTGEAEYFPADLDKTGRFTITFPLYKLQKCTLIYNQDKIATFLAQPGSSLLLAVNPDIKVTNPNLDFDLVAQRVAVMGDDADLNNQYQHFLTYRSSLNDTAYTQNITALSQVYSPAKVPQVLIDYIKEEVLYDYAYKRLSDTRNADSAIAQQLYQRYLVPGSPYAVLHDNFYQMAGYYADRLRDGSRSNGMRYSFSTDKMAQRINNDYSRFLSPEFMQPYKAIQKDGALLRNMKDEEIIKTYFNGDKDAAIAFRYLTRKIQDEFFKEQRDSVAYARNAAILKDPATLFAANLYQLLHSSYSEDDLRIPSTYRLNIFKDAAAASYMPWWLVDSLNRQEAIKTASAGLAVKLDSTRIREVNNEAGWQAVLKSYRGKVVVISMYNHNFRKENATLGLYNLEKLQALYKGKNVVFLKCIIQRQRSDKMKQLFGYLLLMDSRHQLQNVLYIDRKISAMALMEEDIEGNMAIYGAAGEAHHPAVFAKKHSYKDEGNISLTAELNAVLAGKGHYYESDAAAYFIKDKKHEDYVPGYRNEMLKTWTRRDSAGAYEVYTPKEPDRPDYETGDSVYKQVVFMADSFFVNARLVLHRQPVEKNSSNRLFYAGNYERETKWEDGYRYEFNKPAKLLQLYNKQKKLQRQYRVIMINTDILVLERL